MQSLSDISQFDLYFFVNPAADTVLAQKELLNPMCAPVLGADWAMQLAAEAPAYREAVELLIRENLETGEALQAVEQLLRSLSQWREFAVGLARNAPPHRRDMLLRGAGYGLGSPRSPKDAKDVLLTIKSRMEVLAAEFARLGMLPEVIDLPRRLQTKIEARANDVAREKAEDSLVRTNVNELHKRLSRTLTAAWRAADLVSLQAQLLADRDDLPASERASQHNCAKVATEVSVMLDKALGEARVQARQRAAKEVLPAGLAEAQEVEEETSEEAA